MRECEQYRGAWKWWTVHELREDGFDKRLFFRSKSEQRMVGLRFVSCVARVGSLYSVPTPHYL